MTRRDWLLVLLAGAAVWANSLGNGFHYDDQHSIVDNVHLRDVGDPGRFFTDPATFSVDADKGMFRPLLVTSFALNHAIAEALQGDGYAVEGYHLVNIAVHLGAALAVWWLAGLLGAGRRARLLAGLLFAVHPVASEPVNYISSRSESLAALSYLLALALFLRAESGGRRWLVGVWLAMTAGLLTKSTVLTLPASLLLLDALVLCRGDLAALWRRLPVRHLPGWGVAAGYLVTVTANGWLTRSLQQDVRAPGEQLLTQLKGLAFYLQLLAVPARLSVDPQFAVQEGWEAALLPLLLLALSLGGGALWLWRTRRLRALFLGGWVLLYVLPTTVVPLNVLVNERRAYLPLAVLCLAGALLVRPLLARPRARALGLACAAVLAVLAVQRNQVWADELSLWRDAVAKGPRMARPHLYLGNAFKDQAQRSRDRAQALGHWRSASRAYERAHSEARDLDLSLRSLNNRGGVHLALAALAADEATRRREFARAEALFRQAVERNPGFADALINLGNVVLTRAREAPSEAERQRLLTQSLDWFGRALEVRPNHYQGHGNLGVAYEDLGRFDAAERHYRRALHLVPGDHMTQKNLAHLLYRRARQDAEAGRLDAARARLREAEQRARRALQLNPAVPGGRDILRVVIAARRSMEGQG